MTDTVNDPNPENIEAKDQTVVIKPAETPILLNEAPPVAPVPATPAAPVVDDGGAVEYEKTGDVSLDMALDFMGKAGIGADHPAMQAAAKGDFAILKATLAAKGTQGWEQFVALGESAFARTQEQAAAKATALKDMVYKAAGGQAEWNNVQQWASSNATPEEKAEINALLNKGGLAAKGAVKYLVDAYSRANNVVVNPADPTANAIRGGMPNANTGPLSAKEYSAAVQQLNVKLGGRLEGSPEYESLQKRRSMGR